MILKVRVTALGLLDHAGCIRHISRRDWGHRPRLERVRVKCGDRVDFGGIFVLLFDDGLIEKLLPALLLE